MLLIIIAVIAVILVVAFVVGIIIAATSIRSESKGYRGGIVSIRPDSKGDRGERAVAQILGGTVTGQQYVINDLLFKTQSDNTCQIDHIYINSSGIYVIETKNYAGLICGTEAQREWTQVLAYGNERNKFYNPIKQNSTHIYHLSEYLKIKNIFHNIVVFVGNADLSNVYADNVFNISNLQFIKNRNTGLNLSVGKMEYYYNKLLELKNENQISREEHINNIHEKQYKLQQGFCPRCNGGRLILRNGKSGQFFGCTNYPKCKFTKNIFD